mgnify:CR=1 FL=1
MNKKILIIVLIVVLVLIGGGGYYYWKIKAQKLAEQQRAEDAQKITDSIGNNVSPDVATPTVNLPNTNANPYNKTNPFSDLKTNPFQ